MDQSKSPAGYPRIEKAVILAQTDTTVGFLSQDAEKLAHIKGRKPNKPFLKNIFSLKELKKSIRIPKSRKKELRRAKRTTYIVKNQAFRVATFPASSAIFRNAGWFYSTSANKSGEKFDYNFAKEKADIIVINEVGLFESEPSSLIKCNERKKVRLR